MRRGYFLPILVSFRLGTQGRLVFILNWYPHFLDQSYAPVSRCRETARRNVIITDIFVSLIVLKVGHIHATSIRCAYHLF